MQANKKSIFADGYSVLDIVYFFNNSKNAISKSEFELPQFVLIDIQIASRNVVLSSGKYKIQQILNLTKFRNIQANEHS